MIASTLPLALSIAAALLVVTLGPRPRGERKLAQVLGSVRRRPPGSLLRTRVALLVLAAALLVVALGGGTQNG